MSYDYNDLGQGTNIAEWSVIMNDWTGGIFFTGLICIITIALFAIMKNSGQETDDSFIASCFAGFVIAAIAWSIRFLGLALVPTSIPIIFLSLTAVFISVKLIKKAFE